MESFCSRLEGFKKWIAILNMIFDMEKCLFYGNVMFLLLQYRYVVVMAFHTAMSASCELRPAIGRLTSSWGTRVYAVSTVSINTFFSLSLCEPLSVCPSAPVVLLVICWTKPQMWCRVVTQHSSHRLSLLPYYYSMIIFHKYSIQFQIDFRIFCSFCANKSRCYLNINVMA